MFMEIHISVNVIKKIEPKQKFVSSTKCFVNILYIFVYYMYFMHF